MRACGSAGRRIARTIALRSGRAAPFHACGSAAGIVAAIAAAEAARPPDLLQIVVPGVLLGVSVVAGMAIMSIPVPLGPRTDGTDARRRTGHGTPSEGGGGDGLGTDRAAPAALGAAVAAEDRVVCDRPACADGLIGRHAARRVHAAAQVAEAPPAILPRLFPPFPS